MSNLKKPKLENGNRKTHSNNQNTLINLYTNEIRDITEFLDFPIYWLFKIIPEALKNTLKNWEVQDVKNDLATHLKNPGCLATSGNNIYAEFNSPSIYRNFDSMIAKYKTGDYTDYEKQAHEIIANNNAYYEYVVQLKLNLEQLREQMEYQGGFNPKLFGLDCTDNRNYLNEKNKPKCELCSTPTSEFGKFCVENQEMRHTYQQIIAKISRISEENKQHPINEYIELLRAINHVRLWYVEPGQFGSRRWIY